MRTGLCHVNGQQLRTASLLNSFQKQGPADRSFLLFAPAGPSPPPTSAPAPLAPRGSQASKRKFLIGHYITGGLATAAACPGSTSGALSAAELPGQGLCRPPPCRQEASRLLCWAIFPPKTGMRWECQGGRTAGEEGGQETHGPCGPN